MAQRHLITDNVEEQMAPAKGRARTGKRAQKEIPTHFPLSDSEESLGKFLDFIRNEWRDILAEMVAAGVTAYLEAREKPRRSRKKAAHI